MVTEPAKPTKTSHVVERIRAFNAGRNPKLMQLKYKEMRQSSFSFFRGTCHLFYQDWPINSKLNKAHAVWICGDLHLENYGSYKGDNRLVYFDMNDFDEAALAPCSWDVARLLTSVFVGAQTLKLKPSDALSLNRIFLEAYIKSLIRLHTRTIELENAKGMVKELLYSLKDRPRASFLDKYTTLSGKERKLHLANPTLQTVTPSERVKVLSMLEKWAASQQNPEFYKLLDIAHHIAGTGSLGIERYILLVEGKGSPNENYLLDLKAENNSSLQPYLQLKQPDWANQAARVVQIEKWMQANPPALLTALEDEVSKTAFVLRELQPSEDRVDLAKYGKLRRLEKLVTNMGQILAWNQTRSGGKHGAAIGADLLTYAENSADWHDAILNYAEKYSKQVEKDYAVFAAAYDANQL